MSGETPAKIECARRPEMEVIDLGRMGYAAALSRQQAMHEAVVAGEHPGALLLVEHDPVITVSNRESAAGHLLASAAQLKAAGVEVQPTDRGGDITYHGPGQLVAYPIVSLERMGVNVRQYVRLLEQIVIETVGAFGIAAQRDACAVGVWVGAGGCGTGGNSGDSGDRGQGAAKIAAIGVRVRRWVAMHGLALNVTTDLDHFRLIVPCGLHRPVTSMARILGDRCPDMPAVKAALTSAAHRNLALSATESGPGDIPNQSSALHGT